ncbi:TPA: hypothetical protein ACIZC1_002594 [Enterococcus faecalis]
MTPRKKYDYNGIEISSWNKGNIVYYVQCDCGQLAKREYGKNEQFKCSLCKREYHRKLGEYILVEK